MLVAVLAGGTLRGAAPAAAQPMVRTPIADYRAIAVAPAESLATTTLRVRDHTDRRLPTVLFLPGPIGSAFSMRHLSAALATEGVSSIVIDLLGMGESTRPIGSDYSLTRQAVRVQAVLDSLRVERVLIVALGTSASAAFRFAAAYPARVSGIVSMAGGPVDQQATRGVGFALTFAPLLKTDAGRALGRRKFVHSVREQSANSAWCTDAVTRAYLAPFDRDLTSAMRALRAMRDAREPLAIREVLRGVQAPLWLLVGDKRSSNAPTDDQLRLLRGAVRHVRVDTIPNAGTMLHEEQPAAVVHAILSMLASTHPRAAIP
ncbi:MAG: alpha/beta hydrolase [Gemmatimonadaceae bacterium]|nr:alpha/beta hydrolase [Gemmatimonadaceae bacterium]